MALLNAQGAAVFCVAAHQKGVTAIITIIIVLHPAGADITEEVNNVFNEIVQEFTIQEDYAEVFIKAIADTYKNGNSTQLISRSELLKEINDLNSRIAKARELLLNGDIDGADYKTIKSDNEYKINVLEAKLAKAA